MEFKAEYRSYTTRYFGMISAMLIMIIAFFIYSLFDQRLDFLSSIGKIIPALILITPVYQIIGYFGTNKNPKLLKLDPDSLTFYFFRHPTLTLKYSEIESLEYTKDIFKHFEFTLKNGERKMVYSTLKNPTQAFEEIQKRINQTN